MALEHALLVALSEKPAAGLELAKRFERSIGFFWSANHQQIYRVLARMEADGWVDSETVKQHGPADKKVYTVTRLGQTVLSGWLAAPAAPEPARSDLTVKMRGASFGNRKEVLAVVHDALLDHRARLDYFNGLMAKDYPDPGVLADHDLDMYLVLRGGIMTEEFFVKWLREYLDAHNEGTTQ